MEEPRITEEIEKQMEEAKAKAEKNGHSLKEWRWDGHGYWRAWCEHRNCYASIWVTLEGSQPYGGGALLATCYNF